MRKFLILLLVLFQGANSFAAPACEKGRNFIFLIHGINGSERTFGSMEKYLNLVDSCNQAQDFVYNTGNSKLSTYHFSDDLNNFIQKSMEQSQFSEKDKISLVMHSQGGIVGTLWLNKVRQSDKELFQKVDSFITLSTPYWGSSMANLGDNFFFTLPEKLDNPISPVGRSELEEMSHGSATIKAMQKVYQDIFSHSHIRGLAIGGLKRNYNPYFGEDDTTVSVYSSRPDHYSLDVKVFANNKLKIRKDSFSKTELVPFVPVMATHFKFDLPGVASLPSDCLVETSCNHPAIGPIIKHLTGQKIESEELNFRKYRVNIYIEGWKELIKSSDDVTVDLVKPHGEDETVDFKFRPGNELSTSFSGVLKNAKVQTLIVKLKVNGKVVKVVETPVKGGHSSFINFDLTAQ